MVTPLLQRARRAARAAACAVLVLAPLPAAHAAEFSGTVTRVSDGDTLWVRPAAGGAPRPVRLQGIDAPEICQAHGREARAALAARVLGQRVTVRSKARDGYRRWVGRVSTPAEPDLNGWLVAQGHAWSSRWRQHRGPYAEQEARARQARRGLWAAARPQEPRAFRRAHGPCEPARAAQAQVDGTAVPAAGNARGSAA